jgi:RHS repeat-associated protein
MRLMQSIRRLPNPPYSRQPRCRNVASIAVPNPTSKYYTFTFDELGRKTSETYPLDYSGTTRTETYHYDVANHLDWYKNPSGQTKTLTYDNRGRLTDTSWTNDPTKGATGPAVHISYDSTRPTGITTSAYTVAGITLPATTLGFGYDEANNRTFEDQTITGLPTRRVQTLPDADGSRKSLVVSTGGTTNFANNFEYTNRNELRNINNGASGNGQPLFTYSYDASGNVTQRQGRTLSGDTTTTVYDAINRATDCTHAINGTNFSASHYDYSKLGNLKDVIRGSSAYEDGKGDYFNAYDDGNELTAAIYSAASSTDPNPGKTISYGVLNKRRDSMTVTDNTVTPSTTNSYVYVHNDPNQYSKIVVNGTDRLMQYDYDFNLISYNGWTYSYDAENRLVSVGGSHSATFAYDAVGRCVRRIIDNATTVLTYDQWTPVVEWDANGNSVATNAYGARGDEILSRAAGSTQLFYKSDPMGNVRFLLNGSGTIVEKYIYDAFGLPTITQFNGSQPTNNRFMFSGREYFPSLGLYDMRNRIYDPLMGRFYQTDPIGFAGDPTNLYRFCGNNPLLGGDPTGLQNTDARSMTLSIGSDFEIGGGGIFSDGSGGSDLFNDPIGYSSIPWSSYADTSIYVMGMGGAAFATPVSSAIFVGNPTNASAVTADSSFASWRIAADHMVRQICDAISRVGEDLGVTQNDLDALAAMPMSNTILEAGQLLERAPALMGRVARIGRTEALTQRASFGAKYVLPSDRTAVNAFTRTAMADFRASGGKIINLSQAGKNYGRYNLVDNVIELYPGRRLDTLVEELVHFRQAQQYGLMGKSIPWTTRSLLEADAQDQLLQLGFRPFKP